jgi:hypothetical protein
MSNLERIMNDLKTTIGEKQRLGQLRKPRKSTRADGTNPRAKGTNPRAKGTNPKERDQAIFLVEQFDSFDWEQLLNSQKSKVIINE